MAVTLKEQHAGSGDTFPVTITFTDTLDAGDLVVVAALTGGYVVLDPLGSKSFQYGGYYGNLGISYVVADGGEASLTFVDNTLDGNSRVIYHVTVWTGALFIEYQESSSWNHNAAPSGPDVIPGNDTSAADLSAYGAVVTHFLSQSTWAPATWDTPAVISEDSGGLVWSALTDAGGDIYSSFSGQFEKWHLESRWAPGGLLDGGGQSLTLSAADNIKTKGSFGRYGIRVLPPAPTSNAPWEMRAPMPRALSWGMCSSLGTDIYTFGGYSDADGYVVDCFKYDTVANTWSSIADMPSDAHYGTAVEVGGLFYVITPDSTLCYDPDTDTWETKTHWSGQPDAWYIACGAIGTTIYAIRDDYPVVNVLEYDTLTDTWSTSDVPVPDETLSVYGWGDVDVCVLNGRLYLTTGWYGNDTPDGALASIDPLTETEWTLHPSTPVPSDSPRLAASTTADRVLQIAGYDADLYRATPGFTSFDVTWTTEIPAYPRAMPYVVAVGAYLYVMGGELDGSWNRLSTDIVERFPLASLGAPPPPPPGSEMAVTLLATSIATAPGTLRGTLRNAEVSEEVVLTLDVTGEILTTITADATGGLVNFPIPIPGGITPGTYTITATAAVSGETAGITFSILESPPSAALNPGDASPVVVPVASGVQRWVLQDPVAHTSYTFPINPKTISDPHPRRVISNEVSTSIKGLVWTFEGASTPTIWSIEGHIMEQSMYDALDEWFHKPGRIFVVDHFLRYWVCKPLNFRPTPYKDRSRPWTHKYTAELLVFGEVTPS